MAPDRTLDFLTSLVLELTKLPGESEYVEFKGNRADPNEIGEYISALANSIALIGKSKAYMVWGIEDTSHRIIGTTFSPKATRKGNEELESWLLHNLKPQIQFWFWEFLIDGMPIVLLEIERAAKTPVRFQGREYIRVGSYKKRLKECPEKERELWLAFENTPFEDVIAAESVRSEDVLKLIDYSAYFDLLDRPFPETKDGILKALEEDSVIRRNDSGAWDITNLGAILFSKQLSEFRSLRRKAIRVVFYSGNNRINTVSEQEGTKGYANGFEGLISFINARLPPNEVIGPAFRKEVPMYPELAIRELVANALIHQDFFISGAGPMVEIFSDRMEITNPGKPLVETERFLDKPPQSRNEAIAALMRRIGICEERGSGIDKAVWQTEVYQLPAPLFESAGNSLRALLFSHRPLTKMDRDDRVRACYLHACLRHVSRDFMTNASLRERFGIEPKNRAQASRLIKEAVEAGSIRPYDPDAAPKIMKYVPFWA